MRSSKKWKCVWKPNSSEELCVRFSLPVDNIPTDNAPVPAPRQQPHLSKDKSKYHNSHFTSASAHLFMCWDDSASEVSGEKSSLKSRWLLGLSSPILPSPRSKSSSVCCFLSIYSFIATTLPFPLTHTFFSHFSWKNAQGCLLDLVLYQIKLYSTALLERCALHGCTLWVKVCVVISLYPKRGEWALSLPQSGAFGYSWVCRIED